MNVEWKRKETELKLDILQSLARCQRALASILETMAVCGNEDEQAAITLRKHAETIERYQLAIAEKIIGIPFHPWRASKPGPVWLHPQVCRPHAEN